MGARGGGALGTIRPRTTLPPDAVMSLYALGISHTTAPLEVRERVVFTPEVLTDALRDLTKAQHAREAAILSTCNRTEVYFADGDPAPVASWLAQFHGLPE